MERVELDLFADRYVPFAHDIQILGHDLTDANLAMQIRQYRDAPGDPLASLGQTDLTTEGLNFIYAETDTVANHVAGGVLSAVPDGLELTDTIALTVLRIVKATQAWPFPAERGDDAVFYYDIQGQTPAPGAIWELWFTGKFTLRAGVTEIQ